MINKHLSTVFILLLTTLSIAAEDQAPPAPVMPPDTGIAAIWSQLLGAPTGEQPASDFQPPLVELRFILAGERRFCAEYDIWYRVSATADWMQMQIPATERQHNVGGFVVSNTDFPMTLCRLPMAADWFEAAVSAKGSSLQPLTVWSPVGKNVQTIVAGGASIGRRNNRTDQIIMLTIGDTGCRVMPEGAHGRSLQNCASDWAFPDLMANAMQVKLDDGSMAAPDFFLHMGDYRYFWEDYLVDPSQGQQSAVGHSDDNLGYWLQEFLTPAQEALTIAPWALSRGNHETCPDAPKHWYGKGWYYLFGDVRWPSQACNKLAPSTYFDVGPDGGADPHIRHRVVMIDNSNAYDPELNNRMAQAASMSIDKNNQAYVNSTHWASHIPGVAYLDYCGGQCSSENGLVLQAIDDAFGGREPCTDRGQGLPRCVPSTLFQGHQHFYERIRLAVADAAKIVNIPWAWPQTYIVGHGGTKPDAAAFTPDWCWTNINIPASSKNLYQGHVVADSRHGFVVWRRAADTVSKQAGWAESQYWHTGSGIPEPDTLAACTLD